MGAGLPPSQCSAESPPLLAPPPGLSWAHTIWACNKTVARLEQLLVLECNSYLRHLGNVSRSLGQGIDTMRPKLHHVATARGRCGMYCRAVLPCGQGLDAFLVMAPFWHQCACCCRDKPVQGRSLLCVAAHVSCSRLQCRLETRPGLCQGNLVVSDWLCLHALQEWPHLQCGP